MTPRPEPGPGEILIAVKAAGVNRPDIAQRNGHYPPPPGAPEVLGLEVAGEVAAVGRGASRWRVGDRVAALLGGGGYAQYAVVDARHALPIPEGLDFVAGRLPARDGVHRLLQRVRDRGAEGRRDPAGAWRHLRHRRHRDPAGQGRGARVFATSRSLKKARQAQALGADLSLDVGETDFVEPVKAAGGADVVLEMVGGDYVAKDIAVLKPFGRLVFIAFLGGARVTADLMPVQRKRLVLTGLDPAPARRGREGAAGGGGRARGVAPDRERRLRPIVDRTFPPGTGGAGPRLSRGRRPPWQGGADRFLGRWINGGRNNSGHDDLQVHDGPAHRLFGMVLQGLAGTVLSARVKAKDHLAYYATRFSTAEINASFYRLPTERAVAAWRNAVPDGFLFA